MQQIKGVNVLFIAGFGPIVHEADPSRQLYRQILGIRFKEERGRLSPHGSNPRRKDFRAVAALAGGAVLLWYRFLAKQNSCAASLA